MRYEVDWKRDVTPIPKPAAAPKAAPKPIRARSAKTEKVYAQERRPLVAKTLLERPWCELKVSPQCRKRADCLHEIVKRSAGGSITDPANCKTACGPCNSWVEDNPKEARALGLSKRAPIRSSEKKAS